MAEKLNKDAVYRNAKPKEKNYTHETTPSLCPCFFVKGPDAL